MVVVRSYLLGPSYAPAPARPARVVEAPRSGVEVQLLEAERRLLRAAPTGQPRKLGTAPRSWGRERQGEEGGGGGSAALIVRRGRQAASQERRYVMQCGMVTERACCH